MCKYVGGRDGGCNETEIDLPSLLIVPFTSPNTCLFLTTVARNPKGYFSAAFPFTSIYFRRIRALSINHQVVLEVHEAMKGNIMSTY